MAVFLASSLNGTLLVVASLALASHRRVTSALCLFLVLSASSSTSFAYERHNVPKANEHSLEALNYKIGIWAGLQVLWFNCKIVCVAYKVLYRFINNGRKLLALFRKNHLGFP
ncbi:unnamed protein product [Ostreobium quekettii]|uniref:Uncharacterized protein n=1 Tax=Ostreobium quekettii TaxID=121088 RepID=A0A8S1IW38_9CHLO|nr:unnamed protein product [Ostreobium quekettii]CAD7697895.1 unnamed protein product [Ostreobium quekettii]